MNATMVKPDHSRALIEAAKAGDSEAFNELVSQEKTRIRSLVASRLNTRIVFGVDVDDVYQESVLRAYRSISKFEWRETDSFLHWLGGIVENVIRELAKKRVREQRASLTVDVADSGVSPSRAVRRDERLLRLADSLQKLSPEHREVIQRVRIDGLTFEETAQEMSRSPEAVKRLLYRALKNLKLVFGDTASLHLPSRSISRTEHEDE